MVAHISNQDHLIVALDVPHVKEAEALVEHLGDHVSFYKIGMELVYAGGLDLVRTLSKQARRFFSISNFTIFRIQLNARRRVLRISAQPSSPSMPFRKP